MHMARIPSFDTALLWPRPVNEIMSARATMEHILATIHVIAFLE